MVGIISYGAYIPKYRLKLEEIAAVWQKDATVMLKSLGVAEKSVPAIDEDTVTLAIEAAQVALDKSNLKADQINALFAGSESHPYVVNPTSTIVGELLGVGNNYLAVDLEFACKAATTGMQAIAGLVEAERCSYGMTIGADTAQSKPHDALEYTAAAAAAAFIVGSNPNEIVAEIVDYTSFSSDTPDFWRREGVKYPSHGGRFTGEPAYFAHVEGASRAILQRTKLKPADFDYCVFHMPNAKFPRLVAKRLGFTEKQLEPSLTVESIGNPYTASALIGLAATLDMAKPDQKIFLVSYGSGAGSDALVLCTTKNLKRPNKNTVSTMISQKEYIGYVEYLKRTKTI